MKRVFAVFAALAVLFCGAVTGCANENVGPIEPVISSSSSEPTDVLVPEEDINEKPSETDFTYEIIDVDDHGKAPFDDSVKYEYTEDLNWLSGSFNYSPESGVYTALQENSVAVNTSTPFPYGTIACSMKTSTETDNGLVFGLTDNGTGGFWDGGASYYFFFLSWEGYAYLGKQDGNFWYLMKRVKYPFTDDRAYRLKVVYLNARIWCYVDDEFVFALKDNAPLVGTGYGFRAGSPNVAFGDIYVTNDYEFEAED